MRLLVVALCLLSVATAAAAEVARVVGGEHADFTRLVVEARQAGDWRLGRAVDGYELQMAAAVTAYDVTRAFEKIPKDRITAVWRDPDSGRLRFSLACACHAIAFEFRPGIVVIDIRSGPPPEGSSFEQPLDPETSLPPEDPAQPPPAESAAAFDWVAMQREREKAPTGNDLPMPLPTGEVSLDPLRDALLAQISKGAAEGVVEIAEGPLPRPKGGSDTDEGPWTRISIGEMPGVRVGSDRDAGGPMTAEGKPCLLDTELDVASWGLSGPIAAQIGLARSGMLTEFDAPVPEAVLRSARFHVFLGFGAEALQFLDFLDAKDARAGILRAMAQIVDEAQVTDNPFAGMEACDSAAALWAILAADDGSTQPATNANAVARSFSALPAHLRQQLGGKLVDRFLAAEDEETARKLRDSILRLSTDGNPEVEMMDARFHLAEGDDRTASRLAEGVLQGSGPGRIEAAVTLVEAAFRSDRHVDPGLPSMLEAFLVEARGTGQVPALRRARVLALAMTGDYRNAFAGIGDQPETFSDLWSLARADMPDDVFLEEAARFAQARPAMDPELVEEIAARLFGLGFPDLALSWLSPVGRDGPAETRLLAAQALVALRDAPAAMTLLEGLDGPEAEVLRARATVQLGDLQTAAEALVRAGDEAGGQRTVTWTRNWSLVATEGPETWREAADLVAGDRDEPPPGPIARGTALVEESAEARARIEGLLGTLAPPVPSQ
ncbi:MAG: hypothetical protein WAS26_17435 [Paracoccaceae bacterium]